MAFINLHNHSIFSDGTLSPLAISRLAAHSGLNYFSLTDHDTIDGWEEMESALKQEKIHYCYGVEISCSPYENLHILGYGIRINDLIFKKKLAYYRSRRSERVKEILERLAKLGINIKFEDLPVPKGKTVGRPHIADIMKQRGLVKSRAQAFKQYLAPFRPAYVPPNGPCVKEACLAIIQAGGLPVLAHPGPVAALGQLPIWKEAGLGGIEVFYPKHSRTFTNELLALAKQYDLCITAGIDFHGPGTDRDKMYGFEYRADLFSKIEKIFI